MTTTHPPTHSPAAPRPWSLVAAGALHLAVLAPYASSGLMAPGWAVIGLLLLWAGLAAAVFVVHARKGPLALLVPGVAVALWFLALTAGEQLLGWTG